MLRYEDIKSVHLEITNNCQASCPMCSRNINGGLENPLIKLSEWSLNDFKKIMNQKFLSQLKGYYFCGTFGDPIINDNLLDMIQYSVSVAPNVKIGVNTNGSARSVSWWKNLAKSLPKNHYVAFALDGLEDTHHLYRIGTDYKMILRNAQAFISEGGKAEWHYIIFKHNEHQIDQARKLSEELGFSSFVLKNSSRFLLEPKKPVLDRQGNFLYDVEPTSWTPMKFIDRKVVENYKNLMKDIKISCQTQRDQEIAIDAHKDFYPCCYMANIFYSYIPNDATASLRKEMVEQQKEICNRLGDTNLLKRSLEDIIRSDEFQNMWEEYWSGDKKLIVCSRSCGKHPIHEYSNCSEQVMEEKVYR